MSTIPALVCRYVWSIFTLNLCFFNLEKDCWTCFSNGGSVQWSDPPSICCCKFHLGWQGMSGQLSPIPTWMKYKLMWESKLTVIRESSYSENFDLDVFLFPNVAIQMKVKPSKGEHNQHGGHPLPTSSPSHVFRKRIYSVTPVVDFISFADNQLRNGHMIKMLLNSRWKFTQRVIILLLLQKNVRRNSHVFLPLSKIVCE